MVFRANGRTAEINSAWQVDRAAFVRCEGETLAELRKLVASCRLDVPDALPPALALLVGNMGYETIGPVEDLPVPHADAIGLPDMTRSAARRVGNECVRTCRSRWSPCSEQKKQRVIIIEI